MMKTTTMMMMKTVHMWPGKEDEIPLGFSIDSPLPGWQPPGDDDDDDDDDDDGDRQFGL